MYGKNKMQTLKNIAALFISLVLVGFLLGAASDLDDQVNEGTLEVEWLNDLRDAVIVLEEAIVSYGAGVEDALGVAIGSAGAPVLYDGDAGTPSDIDLTNALDDTPVNAELAQGVTSNWAYDWTNLQDMSDNQTWGKKATFKAGEDLDTGDFGKAYYLKYSVDGPRVFLYNADTAASDNDTYPPRGIITYDSLTADGPDAGSNVIVTAPGHPWCFCNAEEDFSTANVGILYYLSTSEGWTTTAPSASGDHVVPFGAIIDHDIETVCFNPLATDNTVAP